MLRRRTAIVGIAAAGVIGAGGYTVSRPSYTDAVARVRATVRPGDMAQTEYLVHHATLAANSHNTQPWFFRARDGGIDIHADPSRRTPVVDPDDHHLFASLGCAAENLRLAAGSLGLTAAVRTEGDVVRLDLGPGGDPDPLFAAIQDRQCTRSDYDGSAIATKDLETLAAAAQIPGARLILLSGEAETARVAALVLEAVRPQTADPAFVAELRHWIRFSTKSAIRTHDGLYAACSGNPVLPDWLGGLLFDRFFTPEAEVRRTERQIATSAGLAVVVSEQNDPAHWVSAGRCYQRFALQATLLGLKHAFLNQAGEVVATRAALARELGLGQARPSLILRFGRAPAMPMSLRRPVAEVMT
jgi:hypothetical protein